MGVGWRPRERKETEDVDALEWLTVEEQGHGGPRWRLATKQVSDCSEILRNYTVARFSLPGRQTPEKATFTRFARRVAPGILFFVSPVGIGTPAFRRLGVHGIAGLGPCGSWLMLMISRRVAPMASPFIDQSRAMQTRVPKERDMTIGECVAVPRVHGPTLGA